MTLVHISCQQSTRPRFSYFSRRVLYLCILELLSMTSSLQPICVESCQASSSIRARRRSSIRSFNPVVRLLNVSSPLTDSAIADEDCEQDVPDSLTRRNSRSSATVPSLSPLSDVHMSDYSTNIRIPRHDSSLSMLKVYGPTTPTSEAPSSAPITRVNSEFELLDSSPARPKLERMKARFASAFLCYFLCGWADGGVAPLSQ